jgi:hypothetical protein
LYIDLANDRVRKALAAQISADIDEYCIKKYDDGPRTHLGASVIGAECMRSIQFSFRWFDYKVVDGRMQRLFKRGHLEEDRFVEYLRGIGVWVWQFEDELGQKQFRCSSIGGHFGGSLDGINCLPERYNVDPSERLLCEFKTNGTGAGFNKLIEKGVKFAKPQHYVQMCTYGKFYGLRYALYMNTCKNDDYIHVEIVELDWSLAIDFQKKATMIIEAKGLVPRIAESETFWKCKACDFLGVCHQNHAPMKNCRSCQWGNPTSTTDAAGNAEPTWTCGLNGLTIPKEVIPVGCPAWQEFGK